MSKILFTLLAITTLLALGFDASAQSKKCPKGYVYDEDTGKCVSRRGSG
jgi:hypothetical protein